MKSLLLIYIFVSMTIAQHVTLFLDQVVYNDSDNVDLYINMNSDSPIASFNFTLNGFDNVVSTNSISNLSLSYQYLESLSYVDGYFSGGDIDNNPIPTGGGPFLTVNVDYNSAQLDGQYLTVKDLSPGLNNVETKFYTYDEFGELMLMTYEWVPKIWILGTSDVISWVGQDCAGDVWGQAFEDDCGVCSGGSTNNIAGSFLDCSGECFGEAQLLNFYRDFDGDGLIGGDLVECDNSPLCSADETIPNYYSDEFEQYFDCIMSDAEIDYEPYCPNTCYDNDAENGSCVDDCGQCLGNNQSKDCNGICNGSAENKDWYPDCDLDGQADSTNFIQECGYPESEDIISVCGFLPNCNVSENTLCGLISIDPNNHSFDSNPDCNSNSVDLCGVCDGFNQFRDCQGQCAEWTPICTNPAFEGYLGNIACQGYIGIGSGSEFAFNHGIDDCGICTGDNSQCTGCTDSNATNFCSECTIYDGSCTFALYPGDVNRDGIVNAQDVDGLGIFWHNIGTPREYQSLEWHMQYASDDWDDICAAYADTNGDGFIDHLDLSAILYNWDNTAVYTFSENSTLCYDIDQLDAGSSYRSNFEEILETLEQSDNNLVVRSVIEYLSLLLGTDIEPKEFSLYQNYPNPFNPTTSIDFDIKNNSIVNLSIYDIVGNLVQEVNYGSLSPGLYSFTFDASKLTSGIYFYSLKTSEGISSQKQMMLIK